MGSRPGPNYLMFLSMEISFLLLGPHISHIVFVVFEAHLRDSRPGKTFTMTINGLFFLYKFRSQSLSCVVFYSCDSPCIVQSSPRSCEQSWAQLWIWSLHQRYCSTHPPPGAWQAEYPPCTGTIETLFIILKYTQKNVNVIIIIITN